MSVHGIGIGKDRTRLGRYLINRGLTQGWLERKTGLGETTVRNLCSDVSYKPNEKTKIKVIIAIRDEVDVEIQLSDFW